MRMFERALARARLPVKFSEGFNPRPRLSLPLPRPVGIASVAELLLLEFSEPVHPGTVLTRLGAQLPAGVFLTAGSLYTGKRPPQPETVGYTLHLPPEYHSEVGDRLERLMRTSAFPVERTDHRTKTPKTIDLRAYLLTAEVAGSVLIWTTRITGGGSARPQEFLSAVGLDPVDWSHRVCRVTVRWRDESLFAAPENLPTNSEQVPSEIHPSILRNAIDMEVERAGYNDRIE